MRSVTTIAGLRRVYANVHSDKLPASEIRGQVTDDNQRDE
jgi:hypothetical protein